MSAVCAACPVLQGECPSCGTFWTIMPGGKRHGLTPVTKQAFDGPTNRLFTRNQLGNFIELTDNTAAIEAAKRRLVESLADAFRSSPYRADAIAAARSGGTPDA